MKEKNNIKMAKKETNLELLQGEIQVAVSFTAFMTAVTVFFVGLLITKFDTYDLSIKIPILFLIVSTFGFLYSTLIYSNASGLVSRLDAKKVNRNITIGNSLSEYLGAYFLILAIPLVINVITTDVLLRLAVVIMALAGLFIYHASGFSIMGRHFNKKHFMFLAIIFILEIIMFFTQLSSRVVFDITAIVLILFIFLIAYFAKREE